MSKEQRAMADPVVDQLVAIDIPFPGSDGPIHVDGEWPEIPDVMAEAARDSRLGPTEQCLRPRMRPAKLLFNGYLGFRHQLVSFAATPRIRRCQSKKVSLRRSAGSLPRTLKALRPSR